MNKLTSISKYLFLLDQSQLSKDCVHQLDTMERKIFMKVIEDCSIPIKDRNMNLLDTFENKKVDSLLNKLKKIEDSNPNFHIKSSKLYSVISRWFKNLVGLRPSTEKLLFKVQSQVNLIKKNNDQIIHLNLLFNLAVNDDPTGKLHYDFYDALLNSNRLSFEDLVIPDGWDKGNDPIELLRVAADKDYVPALMYLGNESKTARESKICFKKAANLGSLEGRFEYYKLEENESVQLSEMVELATQKSHLKAFDWVIKHFKNKLFTPKYFLKEISLEDEENRCIELRNELRNILLSCDPSIFTSKNKEFSNIEFFDRDIELQLSNWGVENGDEKSIVNHLRLLHKNRNLQKDHAQLYEIQKKEYNKNLVTFLSDHLNKNHITEEKSQYFYKKFIWTESFQGKMENTIW